MVSDNWPGLETFFVPGEEIIIANTSRDMLGYLREMNSETVAEIGRRARARVLAEHTSVRRAEQFEKQVAAVLSGKAGNEDESVLAGPARLQPRP